MKCARCNAHGYSTAAAWCTKCGSPLQANALNRLGIEYPITDYSNAWDSIRSKAAEALTTIRKVIENVSEDA